MGRCSGCGKPLGGSLISCGCEAACAKKKRGGIAAWRQYSDLPASVRLNTFGACQPPLANPHPPSPLSLLKRVVFWKVHLKRPCLYSFSHSSPLLPRSYSHHPRPPPPPTKSFLQLVIMVNCDHMRCVISKGCLCLLRNFMGSLHKHFLDCILAEHKFVVIGR